MSPSQLEAYEAGEIERMTIGVFRCVDALSGAEDDCSFAGYGKRRQRIGGSRSARRA
jgi:hypothetical protein